MKTNFRSLVMKRAHHIFNNSNLEYNEAVKKSWLLYRLNKELKNNVVTFYFEKISGEIRKAVGTLKSDLINYEFKTDSQPAFKIFSYYDLEADNFRCFKVENFIMIEKPEVAPIKETLINTFEPKKVVNKRFTRSKNNENKRAKNAIQKTLPKVKTSIVFKLKTAN